MVWTAIGWIDMGEDQEGDVSMSPREIREAQAALEDEIALEAENARRAAAGLPSVEEERAADLYAAAEKARMEQEERERSGGPRGQWWLKPGVDGLSGRLVNLGYLDDGAETPTLEMNMEPWQVEVFNEISRRGETGWISIGHVQAWAALEEADRFMAQAVARRRLHGGEGITGEGRRR